jgi:myo-inositol-1(or 4)-monophosphatase
MSTRFETALAAAAAASGIIRTGFARLREIDVQEKAPGDVATEVDVQAEAAIRTIIWRDFPCDTILGEEGGEHPGPGVSSTTSESGVRWIVDPLDGTFNFVHGFPHCAVSIAVESYAQHEKTCGADWTKSVNIAVIANPFTNELFSAKRGEGAFLNGVRLRVGTRLGLADALVGVVLPGGKNQAFDGVWEKVEAVARASGQIRRTGSAALDLAYVAAGRLDGFFVMSLRKWDIAAGALLVTEAGGTVTDLRGGNGYMRDEQCVAGNETLVANLVNVLNYQA